MLRSSPGRSAIELQTPSSSANYLEASLDTLFDSIEDTLSTLAEDAYLADRGLATSLFLALRMGRPLFLEGEPGVGKTEIAKVLARRLDTELVRLQCHEGLDLHQAVYDWNYPKQLLSLQAKDSGQISVDDVFGRDFLLERPLLRAIELSRTRAPVLLIDELDRADDELEAFLLELLGEFQITIPEIGTLQAQHRPIVILTSNRTREVHDALKRRCAYCWIDYPDAGREAAILERKVPGLGSELRRCIVDFTQRLRHEADLTKKPGVSETLDWGEALQHMAAKQLDESVVDATLGFLLKHRDDLDLVRGAVARQILDKAEAAA